MGETGKIKKKLQQDATAFKNETEIYLTYQHCRDDNHSLDEKKKHF